MIGQLLIDHLSVATTDAAPTAEFLRSAIVGLALWWLENPNVDRLEIVATADRLISGALEHVSPGRRPMSRRQQAAEGLADVAGSATLLIGLALVIDPDRARALLVLPASRRRARLIGCLDLSLVPGLLMSRRRRPWMLARAAFNAALAAQYKRTARGPSSANRRRAGQALSVLTVIDVTVGLIMSPDPSPPTPG